MAELIDKSKAKELSVYEFGVSLLNAEKYVKLSDLQNLPTTTEAEIRAKAIEETADKAYLKLHRLLVDKMFEFKLTPMEIDKICSEFTEQLKDISEKSFEEPEEERE